MLQQVDPLTRARYGLNGFVPNSTDCISVGMDQGFHNWLLFSGKLKQIMSVKVFHQGEGPINTIGAFYPGRKARLKFQLDTDWGVLKGTTKDLYFANWNGDPSPVVHQYDRFE
jgi:hypothetical protein